MKLARLRVRNFRCYKEEVSIDFDDIIPDSTAFLDLRLKYRTKVDRQFGQVL